MSATPLMPEETPQIPTQEAAMGLPTPPPEQNMTPVPPPYIPEPPKSLDPNSPDLLNAPAADINQGFLSQAFADGVAADVQRNQDYETKSVLDTLYPRKIKEYATAYVAGPYGVSPMRLPVYEGQSPDQVLKEWSSVQYHQSQAIGMAASEGLFFPVKFIPGWKAEREKAMKLGGLGEGGMAATELVASILPWSLYSKIFMGLGRVADVAEKTYMGGKKLAAANMLRKSGGAESVAPAGFMEWLGERVGSRELSKLSNEEINAAAQAWRDLRPTYNATTGMMEAGGDIAAFKRNSEVLRAFGTKVWAGQAGNPTLRMVFKQAAQGAGTGIALPATGALLAGTPEERAGYAEAAPYGVAAGAGLAVGIPAAIKGAQLAKGWFSGLKGKSPEPPPPPPPDPYPDGGPGASIYRTSAYRPADLSPEADSALMKIEDAAKLGNPGPLQQAQQLIHLPQAETELIKLAETVPDPPINLRPDVTGIPAPTDADWHADPQQADVNQVLLAQHLAGSSEGFPVGNLIPDLKGNQNPALPFRIPVVQLDGRLIAVIPDAEQPREDDITSSTRKITDPYGQDIKWTFKLDGRSPVPYYMDTDGGLRIDRDAAELRSGQRDHLMRGSYVGDLADQLPSEVVTHYLGAANQETPSAGLRDSLTLTPGEQASLDTELSMEVAREKLDIASREIPQAPSSALSEVPNEELVKMGPPAEGQIESILQQPGAVALARAPKPGQHPRGRRKPENPTRADAYQLIGSKSIPPWAFELFDDPDIMTHFKTRITEAKRLQSVAELKALNPANFAPGKPKYNSKWTPNPAQRAELQAHYDSSIAELGDLGRLIRNKQKAVKDMDPNEFANLIEKYIEHPPELDPDIPTSELGDYIKRLYGAESDKALQAARARMNRGIEQFHAGNPEFTAAGPTPKQVQAFDDFINSTMADIGLERVNTQRALTRPENVSPEHWAITNTLAALTNAAHRSLITLGNLLYRRRLQPEWALGHTRTQNTSELWGEGEEARAFNVYHMMRNGLDNYVFAKNDIERRMDKFMRATTSDPKFNVELADALESGRGLQSAATRKYNIKIGKLPGKLGQLDFTLREAVNDFRNLFEWFYPQLKTAQIARLHNDASAIHTVMDEAKDQMVDAIKHGAMVNELLDGKTVELPNFNIPVEALAEVLTKNPDAVIGLGAGTKEQKVIKMTIDRWLGFYQEYRKTMDSVVDWRNDKHKAPNYFTAVHEATIDGLVSQINDENSQLSIRARGTTLQDDILKLRRSKNPTIPDMLRIFPLYIDEALKLIHIEPVMKSIYTESPAPGVPATGMFFKLPRWQRAYVEDWFRTIRGDSDPIEAQYRRMVLGQMEVGQKTPASRLNQLITGRDITQDIQNKLPAYYHRTPLQELSSVPQAYLYSNILSFTMMGVLNALDKVPVALAHMAQEGHLDSPRPFRGTEDIFKAAGHAVAFKATGRLKEPPLSQRMGSLGMMADVLDQNLEHPLTTLGYPKNPMEQGMLRLASLTNLGARAGDAAVRVPEFYRALNQARRMGWPEDKALEYARQKTTTLMVSSGLGNKSPYFMRWPGRTFAPLQQFATGRVLGFYGGAVRNLATTQPGGVVDQLFEGTTQGFQGHLDLRRQPVQGSESIGPPAEAPPEHWPPELHPYWQQHRTVPSIGGLEERASSKARWASLRMLMLSVPASLVVFDLISEMMGIPMSRFVPGLRYGAPLIEVPRDIHDYAMLRGKRFMLESFGFEPSVGDATMEARLKRQLQYQWIPVIGGDIRDYKKSQRRRYKAAGVPDPDQPQQPLVTPHKY
jgi:hypothetical protein